MEFQTWKELSDEEVAANPWWTYRLAKYESSRGVNLNMHYLHSVGGVIVVPLRADGKVLMQKQYRILHEKFRLEFPAGKREAGEGAIETAKRELAEEAKLSGRQFEALGTFEPFGGISDYVTHVFLAHDLFAQELPADDNEEFEDHWQTVEEIDALIASRQISDGWTLAAWALGRGRIVELVDQIKQKP